jgi:hypothetical protein
MATDCRDYDSRQIIKDIMSTFFAVGQACVDVADVQDNALEQAADDYGESRGTFRPVSSLKLFD